MKIRLLIAFSSVLFLFLTTTRCESTRNSKVSKGVPVTGKVGEILVVCDDGIWNSAIKAYLDTGLTQWIMPYLPDVATFELVHRTQDHFNQGVKRFRNTLFITIDPTYQGEHGKIVKRLDVWAKDQLVMDIVGKDFNQVLETCKLGLDSVHKEFDEMEWQRLIRYFKQYKNRSVRDSIKNQFGIDLALPSGSSIVTKRKNFYRIEFPAAARPLEFVGTGTQDAGQIYSGILIYQYDFVDSSQFVLDDLLRSRDTMLKYNVPSEIEGMYMGTQYVKQIYPEGTFTTNLSGDVPGFEMRGMFKFTGLPRHGTGGAFWAYHFVNPNTKKLVCVSGYVDAPPTTSWTHPLREIQAIWKSVELVK